MPRADQLSVPTADRAVAASLLFGCRDNAAVLFGALNESSWGKHAKVRQLGHAFVVCQGRQQAAVAVAGISMAAARQLGA